MVRGTVDVRHKSRVYCVQGNSTALLIIPCIPMGLFW